MTKVLLSNTNTIWGVIAKPQSSNVYRHVLSFENDALKEKFIDDKLFGGQSFRTLLNNSKPLSFALESAINCSFKIDPRDYSGETMESLMNKDFAIVDNNGKISYYAITSATRSGQMVLFEGELDIFFTNDIKDMFNDNDVNIERAMTDRYFKQDDGSIKPIYELPTKHLKTPFYNGEDIDKSISDDILIPKDKGRDLLPTVANCVSDKSQVALIDKILNNMDWFIFYTSLTRETKIEWADRTLIANSFGGSGISFNTKSHDNIDDESTDTLTRNRYSWFGGVLDCVEQILLNNIGYNMQVRVNGETIRMGTSIDNMIQSSATFKGSWTPIPYSPFTSLEGYTTDALEFVIEDVQDNPNQKNLVIVFKDDYHKIADFGYAPFGVVTDKPEGREGAYLTLQSQQYQDVTIQELDYPVYDAKVYNPDISQKFDIKDEIKLNIAPFTKIKIGSSTKTKSLLSPQYFINATEKDKSKIEYKTNYGYMLEAYSTWVEIIGYENIYVNANPRDSLSLFEDIANYSLPTVTDAFNEYISRNKAQLNTNMLKSIGGGVLGATAGLASGNPLGILGGLGSLAKSIGDIASQAATIKDLKNSPDKLNATGSTLFLDRSSKVMGPYLQKQVLVPQLELLIAQFFFKYGYTYKDELIKINDVIDSRYYFNYLKASETFENIKLQASAEIKQIINDTLESGVTIWHVRDLNTFKGIKNYEYKNPEMNLVTSSSSDVPLSKQSWKGIVQKAPKW